MLILENLSLLIMTVLLVSGVKPHLEVDYKSKVMEILVQLEVLLIIMLMEEEIVLLVFLSTVKKHHLN